MQTIGVGIIARDAEKTIAVCVESFIDEVDQCVVVLAGQSTDKTESILRKLRTKYGRKLEIHSFDWVDDFSAARNLSFSKLDTDWLFWCDADDEIYQPENLRNLVKEAKPDVGALWFPYHYAIDEFGNVTTIYERERLLRAKLGWVWKGRLHETVSPLSQCMFARSDDVIVRHNHLAGQPRNERNFHLLNIMIKEDPTDKRVWLYMGHQNFAARNWSDAAEWYLRFGSDNGAIPIERYQALCYCSKAMREMQDKQAIDVALMAVELYPNYRDAYLELAHSYLRTNDFDKAIHWANISDVKELVKEPPHIIFINPLEYTFNKYALFSECYMRKGDIDTAIKYMLEAHRVRPVVDIKKNIEYLEQLKGRNRVIESIKILAITLLNNQEIVKLQNLLDSTPYWFRDLEDFRELEGGAKHYIQQIQNKPEIVEGDDGVLVNIANAVNPENLLADLKNDKVTVVCPVPQPDSKQIRAFSQRDMEDLIMSQPGRHINNLHQEPSRIICEYDKTGARKKTVKFFLGQGFEKWNPKTISEIGCGGSETAVAKVAYEFARKNWQPIIYAMDNEVWDGVIYRNFKDYSPGSAHLFISSRVPDVFNVDFQTDQKWLWVHDIHCFDRLTPEVANKLDVIIALSQWHANHIKRTYPFLKDAEIIDMDENKLTYDDQWTPHTFYEDATIFRCPKIAIIGNGLDLERFDITETRVPHRFIWCSSPDRGLEEVLNLWPLIKKNLPDAELKIFYGWDYFDSSLWIQGQRDLKQRLLKLIKQDGVEWCGRVGQEQIARELTRADAMLYPPHDFRETYGIAFLEAQAAGTICFYRQNGALGETIGNRGIPLALDLKPEEIVKKITLTLSNPDLCATIRRRGKMYALKRSWAKQTEKMLSLYNGQEGGYESH